jgi:CHASE3 domain sensor protein
MNTRIIRLLIVVIGVVIGFVASYFLDDLEARINTQRTSTDTLREQAKALTAAIADVRAGQVAYVARGQGEAFWMSHVESLLPALQKHTLEFGSSLTAPAAQTAFDAAAGAIENFRTLDTRVREFVASGNALLAADLIFSDGLESTATASTKVTAALNEELQARSALLAQMRGSQLTILAITAGAILLLMLALAYGEPAQKAPEPQVVAPVIEPVRFEAPLPKARPAITPKLVITAGLCRELARVADTEDLPDLLARAARVLNASGIIVWVEDSARRDLGPVMSHGYADQTVARMGRIHSEANNAAAAAYRTAEVRTVSGDGGAAGALIAPLLTPNGCIGVLSIEMKGGLEKDESSQALATIFAAQLATLVSPPAAAVPIRAAAQA